MRSSLTSLFVVALPQDDQPLWVGLTTDPTDERDFPNGKFIQLTAGSSVAIDAYLATAEDLSPMVRLVVSTPG